MAACCLILKMFDDLFVVIEQERSDNKTEQPTELTDWLHIKYVICILFFGCVRVFLNVDH